MSLFPEKEGQKGVFERPGEIDPLTIERKEVVTPVASQFNAQVLSDNGSPLIQTPQGKTITIVLPQNQTFLTEKSKGSVYDSVTWFAKFWLRLIKKALFFGWKVEERK